MVTRAFPVWQIAGFIALSTLGGTGSALAETSGAAFEELSISDWRQGSVADQSARIDPAPNRAPPVLPFREIQPLMGGLSLVALSPLEAEQQLWKTYIPFGGQPAVSLAAQVRRESTVGFGQGFALSYSYDVGETYLRAARGRVAVAYANGAFGQAEAAGFEPEFALSYEAGINQWIAGDWLQVGADLFYNEYRNFSTQAIAGAATVPGAGRVPQAGLARYSLYGAEFKLKAEASGWQAWATFGLLGAGYNEYAGSTGFRAFSGRDLTPDLAVSAGVARSLGVAAGGRVSVAADFQHLAVQTLMDGATTGTSADLVNIGLTWAGLAGSWRMRAGVNNLFDKRYSTSLSAQPVLDGDGASVSNRMLFLSVQRSF